MKDLSALRMKISSGSFAMEDVADQQLVTRQQKKLSQTRNHHKHNGTQGESGE